VHFPIGSSRHRRRTPRRYAPRAMQSDRKLL
jgi:hypothetical protein